MPTYKGAYRSLLNEMALCNRQEPAKEAHRGKERKREMDSEGEAGSLTDGLTGRLLLSGQKCTEALSRHKHAISGGSFNQ